MIVGEDGHTEATFSAMGPVSAAAVNSVASREEIAAIRAKALVAKTKVRAEDLPWMSYSWIGRPIQADKKQFANEQEGLRQLQDHCRKALSEENSDLPGPFLFM